MERQESRKSRFRELKPVYKEGNNRDRDKITLIKFSEDFYSTANGTVLPVCLKTDAGYIDKMQ